jgi:hypothetical protein
VAQRARKDARLAKYFGKQHEAITTPPTDFGIPDNERWLQETQAESDLARATEWSKQHHSSEIQTDALLAAAAQGK